MIKQILGIIPQTFKALIAVLRRYFVAGLLAFAPIGITIWAIGWVIERLNNLFLPGFLRLFGIEEAPSFPLLGLFFTVIVIVLFGMLARNFLGMRLVSFWEMLLAKVPVVRSIYNAVKQLVQAILHTDGRDFSQVVLIEYPRKGIYGIAFVTSPATGPVQDLTEGDMMNVFIPTTPNPTSGFYLLVPKEDIIELEITVEEAFKMVMSAGLVSPESREIAGHIRQPETSPSSPEATSE